MVFLLGLRVGGPWPAWTSGLLSSLGLYLLFHNTVTIDYLLSFWILLSLYLLFGYLSENRTQPPYAAVFFGSMACFTKYHGVVYFAALCLIVALLPATRRTLHGKYLLGIAATALLLPVCMLAQEALTWHFYGWDKTHIHEVLAVMTWPSYVRDLNSNAYVEPHWHYYFMYCWKHLTPVVCVLGLAGIVFILRDPLSPPVILVCIFVLWMLWASTASLKNARYCLPMVYLFFIFAGLCMRELSQKRTALAVGCLLLATALLSIGSIGRIQNYLETERTHTAAYNLVNAQSPEDAVVLTELPPFGHWYRIEDGPIERTVISPESPHALQQADYFVAGEDTYQIFRPRMLAEESDYPADREYALEHWNLLLDVGDGDARVQVFKNNRLARDP